MASNEHSKRPSATKSGPGRYHAGGEPGTRITKQRKKTRAYVALLAAWAAKVVPNWKGDRDADGVPITLVGRNADGSRRIWLAGISAQRGY